LTHCYKLLKAKGKRLLSYLKRLETLFWTLVLRNFPVLDNRIHHHFQLTRFEFEDYIHL